MHAVPRAPVLKYLPRLPTAQDLPLFFPSTLFLERVSCNPDWYQTHSVAKDSHDLLIPCHQYMNTGMTSRGHQALFIKCWDGSQGLVHAKWALYYLSPILSPRGVTNPLSLSPGMCKTLSLAGGKCHPPWWVSPGDVWPFLLFKLTTWKAGHRRLYSLLS